MFRRLDPFGNPNVGVYVRATEEHLWVPPGLTEQNVEDIETVLGLKSKEVTIGGSQLIGSLTVANKNGIIVADFASDKEIALFKESGLEVMRFEHARLNAAGNNILANDKGAIIHEEISRTQAQKIADVLDVEIIHGSIADVPTIGTAAVATNNGVLAHPLTTEAELAFIKSILHVPARIGTVNHGNGLLGAGMVANNRGFVVGSRTTGIELGRIDEALGFLGDDEDE